MILNSNSSPCAAYWPLSATSPIYYFKRKCPCFWSVTSVYWFYQPKIYCSFLYKKSAHIVHHTRCSGLRAHILSLFMIITQVHYYIARGISLLRNFYITQVWTQTHTHTRMLFYSIFIFMTPWSKVNIYHPDWSVDFLCWWMYSTDRSKYKSPYLERIEITLVSFLFSVSIFFLWAAQFFSGLLAAPGSWFDPELEILFEQNLVLSVCVSRGELAEINFPEVSMCVLSAL